MIGAFWSVVSGVGLRAWGYVGALLAILAAMWKIYAAGRAAADAAAKTKVLDDVDTRNKVEDRVAGADDAERQRMRDRWTRPE